jgi:transcription antitermination factor NusG
MTNSQKSKVEFAPGAFDDFDGTQEELDALRKSLL